MKQLQALPHLNAPDEEARVGRVQVAEGRIHYGLAHLESPLVPLSIVVVVDVAASFSGLSRTSHSSASCLKGGRLSYQYFANSGGGGNGGGGGGLESFSLACADENEGLDACRGRLNLRPPLQPLPSPLPPPPTPPSPPPPL